MIARAALSLGERAATAARAELRCERTGKSRRIGQVTPPPAHAPAARSRTRWSLIYVMERMEEAFRTLARLPMATRPRAAISV